MIPLLGSTPIVPSASIAEKMHQDIYAMYHSTRIQPRLQYSKRKLSDYAFGI